jgi:nucleotide-binding universal stress UspA family protein
LSIGKKSALVALNESISSQAVVSYICDGYLGFRDWKIILFHLLRRPSASGDLMGKRFVEGQSSRLMSMLQEAKTKLVEIGFDPDAIEIQLEHKPFPTVAEGIIEQFRQRDLDMVVIGRKRMSKAEEFVMGDPSVKLIRALEGTAVLVVKS